MEIRKLGDQSGVTLVLAMVVFLIATLLSMTLITGALSSVQNAARQRKEEQAYLSSVSAASLLKHYICDNGAFVRHVEISKDDNVYNTLSPESKAAVDAEIDAQRDKYHLKDSNGNYSSGWLAFPEGEEERSNGTLPMPPTLCETPVFLTTPDNVEKLITYSLCYLLKNQNAPPDPDHEPTLIIKTAKQETTVTFKMEDGTKRWKLTAELSTKTTGLQPYLSVLTFSCNVNTRTVSSAVTYQEPVTNPLDPGDSYYQEKHFTITVNTTDYRWTLDTANRGKIE